MRGVYRDELFLMSNPTNNPGMRRWVAGTVVLYGLSILLLTMPLVLTAFSVTEGIKDRRELTEIATLYSQWQYWALVAVLMLLETLFLFTPLQIARERPVTRASWTTLALTSGLMCGLLVFALLLSFAEVLMQKNMDDSAVWISAGLGLLGWLFWGIVFGIYASTQDPASALKRMIDRLLAGSIAELLIAVPCHVYVRNKNYCCAGTATFVGLATGLAVLLFAFGPAVMFLFVARVRRLRKAESEEETDGQAVKGGIHFGRQSSYALFWTTGAFLFFFILRLGAALAPQHKGNLEQAGRMSFLLMSALVLYYGYYAFKQHERGRLWAVAAMSFVTEAAVLVFVFSK